MAFIRRWGRVSNESHMQRMDLFCYCCFGRGRECRCRCGRREYENSFAASSWMCHVHCHWVCFMCQSCLVSLILLAVSFCKAFIWCAHMLAFCMWSLHSTVVCEYMGVWVLCGILSINHDKDIYVNCETNCVLRFAVCPNKVQHPL